MLVLIHRRLMKDSDEVMKEFYHELCTIKHNRHVKLDRVRRRISIDHDSVTILFLAGDGLWTVVGMRVDIYNTDSNACAEYLARITRFNNSCRVNDISSIAHYVVGRALDKEG